VHAQKIPQKFFKKNSIKTPGTSQMQSINKSACGKFKVLFSQSSRNKSEWRRKRIHAIQKKKNKSFCDKN